VTAVLASAGQEGAGGGADLQVVRGLRGYDRRQLRCSAEKPRSGAGLIGSQCARQMAAREVEGWADRAGPLSGEGEIPTVVRGKSLFTVVSVPLPEGRRPGGDSCFGEQAPRTGFLRRSRCLGRRMSGRGFSPGTP